MSRKLAAQESHESEDCNETFWPTPCHIIAKKIYHAIAGANADGGNTMSEKDVDEVTSQVEWDIKDRDNVSVEEIQDIVEQELMKYDFYDIAKKVHHLPPEACGAPARHRSI